MKKRIYCLLLAIVLVVGLMPITVFATTYPSYMIVDIEDLRRGDVLEKGARIYAKYKSYVEHPIEIGSEYPYNKGPRIEKKSYYTCDRNYYVVGSYDTQETVYFYPLPTVTFNANGGSVDTASKWVIPSPGINCTYGDLPTSTRANYTFAGWFTAAEGGTQVTSSTTVTQTADHTLYAHWIPNSYTVSFNGNGATGGSTATQNFTYDAAQNLRANGFVKNYTVSFVPGEGLTATSAVAASTFKGWNTAANGSGTSYSNGQSVKNLTSTNNGSVTLYAQWQNGSITLPTPTKSGKVCTGWYTSSGTKVGDCGDSYTVTGNTTLYAHWETVGYTVTWKNHDGTTLETDEGVAQGATPTYDGATPS